MELFLAKEELKDGETNTKKTRKTEAAKRIFPVIFKLGLTGDVLYSSGKSGILTL